MKRPFGLSAAIFYLLTALMVTISIISFINAVSWVNRPFAGFLMYEFPHVGSMGDREWPGIKAGLRLMDKVISVRGEAIKTGHDVERLARDLPLGSPIQYEVESNNKVRRVEVRTTTFTLKDFLLVFFIPFIGGFALYLLGVIVYILKPNISTSWVFYVLCFSLGTYMVTGFEIQSSYFFVHLHWVIVPLFPAAFVHLGLIFPDRKQFVNRFRYLEYVIYIPALLLAIAYQICLFTFDSISAAPNLALVLSYKQIAVFTRWFTFFCVGSIVALIFYSAYKASSIIARQRARMVLFGVTIAFLPSVIIVLLAFFLRVNFPINFLVLFVIFFPASIAYSIVRHNLFDADVIIKRTVGYFVVTAIVVGAYALVSVSFNVFMGQYQVAQSRLFPIFFTVGVILVFNPLRDRVQALVDRIFFRKEYDYGSVIDKIGGAITSLMDLGQILKRLTRTFIDDMFINTTSVMLLNPEGSAYRVYLADGESYQDVEKVEIKRNEPIAEIIEEEKRELTKNDVLEDPKFKKFSEQCTSIFEILRASLIVPLVFQGKVIGLMNLGEKKSGKAYNREDIDLLHAISNQGAVAIENARLFQENLEKQRMEEELNIARDLQTSMLPATCPKIEGFEIAAYSVAAREVGGDFYDFIDMGEGKAGMVIGDVTGKSVSGALVMSASRSVFRMLSEEERSVSENMIRANRRIKKDVKTGMFVALLYAVLDAESKTINLCSAGQTQPVVRSSRTGETRLLQTRGDTFPLGILDDAAYEETRLELSPGDVVVLYTDGIVEAMNANQEIFGFDRLLEVVQTSQAADADSLLQEILATVNEFAGKADQHDDLTAIVIQAKR